VGGFAHVLYVSCCPANLARDMAAWRGTHAAVRAAVLDHFPHTPHAECAVYLRRRAAAAPGLPAAAAAAAAAAAGAVADSDAAW
jgi:hypothetical protein